jgi:predicted lysophospholipase L1 biosynthesis ABC-type transport system permease subunit
MVNLLISQMRWLTWDWEVGMAALAWLLIPLVAAIGAGLWGTWATRTRRVRGDGPELDGYARFRAAMEKSHSGT